MLKATIIFFFSSLISYGQTNVFGKTIYEWGRSPSSLKWHFHNGGQPHIALDLQDSSNGWTGFEDENGTSAGSGGVVAAPLNTTQRIQIERNGQVLTASVDGVLAFTSSANFGPLISRTSGVVINVYDGQGGTFEIDNFSMVVSPMHSTVPALPIGDYFMNCPQLVRKPLFGGQLLL